jgi:hypothetical protein
VRLSGSESVQVFLSFVYTMYMYILLENQLSRGGYEIPLTVLTPVSGVFELLMKKSLNSDG